MKLHNTVIFSALILAFSSSYAESNKNCKTVYDVNTSYSICKDGVGVEVTGDRADALFRIADTSLQTPAGGDKALIPKAGRHFGIKDTSLETPLGKGDALLPKIGRDIKCLFGC